MLLKLRGGLDSIFVTILLGVLIAAFAVWGIGPGILGGNQSVVAEVGSEQIGTQRFFRTVQNRALTFQEQIGGSMSTNELIRAAGLDQRVLQELVAEAAVAAEATRLGLRATDRQVVEALKSIEGLRAPDGSINAALLQQILATNGLTEQDLLDDIYKGVVRETMIGTLVASSPVPDAYAKAIYTYQGERRSGTLINIGLEDVGEIAAPDDETLAAFFDPRAEDYRSPELRSYRYILVTPQLYAASAEITDEAIQAEYERRERDYIIPEVRYIEQVSVATEEAAQAIIDAVAGGQGFIEAAVANSGFTEDEIALGDLSKTEIEADFGAEAADAVFAMEAGSVSAPVAGLTGFNVFFVADITEGTAQSLESVRAEIDESLRVDAAERQLFETMELVEDALADDPVLDPIAEQFGLTVASVTGLDNRGTTINGEPGVTSSEEGRILQEAYQMIDGDEPTFFMINPADTAAGYFILELTEVAEPADRVLDDVRGQVFSDWVSAERTRKAGELAQTMLERLRAGEDASALVEELGGTSFEARNVARIAGEGSGVSQTIRTLIFDLSLGAAELDAAADGDGYVIARVDSITAGDAENATAVGELEQTLNSAFVNDLLSQYQTYLLAQYPPSINRVVLQQLFDPANDAAF